jgi:hypothetical protein
MTEYKLRTEGQGEELHPLTPAQWLAFFAWVALAWVALVPLFFGIENFYGY